MAEHGIESGDGVLSADDALRFLDSASAVLAGSLEYERTLAEIAQLAVPSLADWCAVDIVQDDGSLRQITSGHPDPDQEELLLELRRRYRSQKAGSEGVVRVVATGEPELAQDVAGPSGAGVELHDAEVGVYERLAPRSYLIVPLLARGRTIGALTFLSTREGRHYGERDLSFAMHLARRFALAIDNARLYDAAQKSHGLLDTIFASAPVGLAFVDTELRIVRVNEAMAAIAGRSVEDHLGRTLHEILGSPIADDVGRLLHRVMEAGEPLLSQEISASTPVAPGDTRHWIASYTPVVGVGDEVIGVSIVLVDMTDQRRALDAERDARRRATFLAQAGAILDNSLDFDQTAQNVARLAVPGFADWCGVSVVDEDGTLRQVAVAHVDPDKVRQAWELNERYPPDPDAPAGTPQVIRSGEPSVTYEVTDDMLVLAAIDEEHLRLLRELAMTSTVIVPLQSRGRSFGALAFVSAESGRTFDEADVELFVELGRRAGVAVENSRLYTEHRRIAHTLQARLLPQRLPEPPGMRLAARYRAAGTYNEVGGDFYDAFEREPGEWAVVIGDVSGKGPEAAAMTALARYTIRSAALNDWTPAQVLERLNDTMLHEDGVQQFVTVALAYVRHEGDAVRARLVLAGHPLPFVVRAGGQVEEVGAPGTLLGMRPEIRLHEVEARLEPGDTLLLYTDGVIEAGPRGEQLGQDGLGALLEPLAGAPPERVVEAVEQAVAALAPDLRARDDVALVALHVVGAPVAAAPPEPLELEVPAYPEYLHELREAAVSYARTLPGMDLDGVRLAVGEACSNAVVHAYGSGPAGTIRLRAEAGADGLVVEVADSGQGLRPRPDSPGMGLGLPLMAKLTRAIDVTHPDEGGTVVRLIF